MSLFGAWEGSIEARMLTHEYIIRFLGLNLKDRLMREKITDIIIPALVTTIFLTHQKAQVMESESMLGKLDKASVMQLAPGESDTLEAPIGTGNNVILKISMNLKSLRKPIEQESIEVPVQLFLTDFTARPTNQPPVELQVKVDCDSTPLKCILPDKPISFDNYAQFIDWLEQGYFTNQVGITYDFHLDPQEIAPSLTQHLFFLPRGGFRFIGTYIIENPRMLPDCRVPHVSYDSQRGNVNTTIATLGGIFYLNDKPYPIEALQQIFPHRLIQEKIFQKDSSKRLYYRKWISFSEITSKVTYEEFPIHRVRDWINVPSEKYSVVRQSPGDKENIKHIACFDGSTGKAIDLSNSEERFQLISTEPRVEGPNMQEAIVKGDERCYIMHYRNLALEKKEAENEIRVLTQEYDKHTTELQKKLETLVSIKREVTALEAKGDLEISHRGVSQEPSLELRQLINSAAPEWQYTEEYWGNGKSRVRTIRSSITGQLAIREAFPQRYEKGIVYPFGLMPIEKAIKEEENKIELLQARIEELAQRVRRSMNWYAEATSTNHPRWEEFDIKRA